jgi:hypothetical protein
VGDALDYALSHAPTDVLGTLNWLEAEGFDVRTEMGGAKAPFGNVFLEYERGPVAVRVTRDRSQWELNIRLHGGSPSYLGVLVTAWEGAPPPLLQGESRDPHPEILPEGVEWSKVVPPIVSWLTRVITHR